MEYAMIMAGGAGTRLWPMSRKEQPKQLIPFIGGQCLLEIAANRLDGVVPTERRLICTGEAFREPIRGRLDAFSDEQILGEPEGRDTVNAIGLTAAVLLQQDPDACFAVLTADHLIEPQDRFRKALQTGFDLVREDPERLITFGITPTYPATGYGYVELGEHIGGNDARQTVQFVEKPDESTARSYLESGNFLWNSGMFIFSAAGFMNALEAYLPEAAQGLHAIADAWNGPDRSSVLQRIYPTLPKISVDYAIMEPASKDDARPVCTVPMDIQWLDVGSWTSYGETLSPDTDGCRSNATSIHVDSHNVLAVSEDPDHVIATVGCHDMVIIHTDRVTMICPASEAQRVKDLANAAPDTLR
ncbi:MAG: mannose-1-phosphate guanyltransferase [Phycisphaerae bacterium]|nr:mannose-1-phosphate guanyltransferase [Phycisphaerae bacterium]|tara:strand:+ start:348 stop:1424 length:1077 start_codon:yes stop_codon:yes gene_type:complete